jgi:tellurite resistance protein TerC
LVVTVVGTTIVVVGIAMIVLPGPAIVVIPLGLGILGLEFAWAKRYLRRIREESSDALDRLRGTLASQGSGAPPPPDRQ